MKTPNGYLTMDDFMNLTEAQMTMEHNYGDSDAVREAGEFLNTEIARLNHNLRHEAEMARVWKANAEALADVINKKDLEIDNLTAVVDAAEHYVHCLEASHYGPYGDQKKQAQQNLIDEVHAYQENQL